MPERSFSWSFRYAGKRLVPADGLPDESPGEWSVSRRSIPKWLGWPLLAAWTYLVLSFLANQAIFHPTPFPTGFWDLQAVLNAEDVWLRSADGPKIHGWFLKTTDETPWVTLYLHGNAGNITHRGTHIEAIREAGSQLLIVDYRGYGKSEGKPSEQGIYRDADAAYEYLMQKGFDAEQIIIHGESLGTAAAADLASRRASAGVILEAPFPSVKAVAQRVLPLIGPLTVSGFETAQKMTRVRVPVLIVHGDRDETIAYALGQRVFEAANEPKQLWTVEGGHHNDIIETAGREVYVSRLRQFYGQLR